MKTEIDIIREVSAALERESIPYMFTGSIAANFYTTPRMTRDIDIVLDVHPSRVEKLNTLFEQDYYLDSDAIRESIKSETMFNMIHNESLIKVDCIIRKNSEYRLTEFMRRRRITVQDFEIYIVSLEDLVLSKLFWAKDSGSEMQLGDVKNLLKNEYDKPYLMEWARELKIHTLLENCLRG